MGRDPGFYFGASASERYGFAFWTAFLELVIRTAWETGVAAREQRAARRAGELRRKAAEAKRPRSLNPPPTPAAVSAQWRKSRDSLEETLRFGALLLDLEPSVDSSPVVRHNRAGTRKVIVARNPGIKGWLREHCPEVAYSTAMRHKQLAARARLACGLAKDVPLDWALPGGAARDGERPAQVRAALPAGRAKLAEIASGCRSKRALSAALDGVLGTPHRALARPRKGPCPAARRRIAERWVAGVLGGVRARLGRVPAGLPPDVRERLARELLAVADGLRKVTA